jgi:hypothetical protein
LFFFLESPSKIRPAKSKPNGVPQSESFPVLAKVPDAELALGVVDVVSPYLIVLIPKT